MMVQEYQNLSKNYLNQLDIASHPFQNYNHFLLSQKI